jgi:hypothetical protein
MAFAERPCQQLGPLAAELGDTEDFSLRLSREETSRRQSAPEIIVVCRLAGILLIRSQTGCSSARLFLQRGVLMLRYITSTLTACALASTVSVFAQEPAPAQPPPAQPAPAQPEKPKETLTGCVMEAKTTDGGTAYVLNKAQGGSAALYVLAGSLQSEVATNVNKKVEVTGLVQQPNAPPAEDAAAANPKVLRPPFMQVESVKVVAETCT